MSLNLKNPRAHELASELAALTGESLTETVIRSLEIRLRQERQEFGEPSKAERILAFAKRFAEGMPKDLHSSDHADLYGEDGLPR